MVDFKEDRVVGPSAHDMANSDWAIATARTLKVLGFGATGLVFAAWLSPLVISDTAAYVYSDELFPIEIVVGGAGVAAVVIGMLIHLWGTGAAVKR